VKKVFSPQLSVLSKSRLDPDCFLLIAESCELKAATGQPIAISETPDEGDLASN